jgi:CxxC motif-containing protein
MSDTRRFVCIVCPRGCALEVDVDGAGGGATAAVLALRGNACKRGDEYGRREILDPRRILTTTVRASGLSRRRLSVRSAAEVPLRRFIEAVRALDAVAVTASVKCGDVIVTDLIGLGVDVLATDDIGLS